MPRSNNNDKNQETNPWDRKLTPAYDDTLKSVPEDSIKVENANVEPPSFILMRIQALEKPRLEEALMEPDGSIISGGNSACVCNSVCTCVPVETCACDRVCTCDTVSSCGSYSSGSGGGGGGYYGPCH